MADYSDLMQLEKKAKPTPPPAPAALVSPDNSSSASLLANQQTSKEEKKKTSLPENQHASKEINQQTSKQLKKFGSYLREDSIKALKQRALLTDKKDYEVLQDAIDFYLSQTDKS